MHPLKDGEYDVIVVDGRDDDDNTVHLEIAVSSGEHRGEVFTVTAQRWARRSVDVLGMPATLVVADGIPRLRFPSRPWSRTLRAAIDTHARSCARLQLRELGRTGLRGC